MRGIMTYIFEDFHFKVVNLPNTQSIDSFYAVSEDFQKTNYYVVLFIDNLLEFDESEINFNAFFEDIIKSQENYDHRMEKNLSMVICAKRETLEMSEDMSRKIYQVEEDPYFFKKYVLTYTDQQVKSFYHEMSTLNNTIEYLYNTLHNHDEFLTFKSNPYQESIYNLVSKIFIKLPFLNLKNVEQQTKNLSKNISESLNTSQNELKNKALKYADEFYDDEGMREKVLDFIGVKTDE